MENPFAKFEVIEGDKPFLIGSAVTLIGTIYIVVAYQDDYIFLVTPSKKDIPGKQVKTKIKNVRGSHYDVTFCY